MAFSDIASSPTLSYTIPLQGLPGDVTETSEPTIDAAVCDDSSGLVAGRFVVTTAFQTGGTGRTIPRKVKRPVSDAYKLAGVVRRVLGFPQDFGNTTDVGYRETASIVRKGRLWILCESTFADPTACADLWFVRFIASTGAPTRNVLGILRYGDADPTGVASADTCFQVPEGMIRPIQACAGVAAGVAGLFEIDFCNNVLTA